MELETTIFDKANSILAQNVQKARENLKAGLLLSYEREMKKMAPSPLLYEQEATNTAVTRMREINAIKTSTAARAAAFDMPHGEDLAWAIAEGHFDDYNADAPYPPEVALLEATDDDMANCDPSAPPVTPLRNNDRHGEPRWSPPLCTAPSPLPHSQFPPAPLGRSITGGVH